MFPLQKESDRSWKLISFDFLKNHTMKVPMVKAGVLTISKPETRSRLDLTREPCINLAASYCILIVWSLLLLWYHIYAAQYQRSHEIELILACMNPIQLK